LTSARIHGIIPDKQKTGRCPKLYQNKKGCTFPLGWVTPISFCEQMIKRKTKAQSSKALQKGLDVLRKFAYEKEDWGPREIARSLNISKSSALRVLQTLKNENFLSPAETDGKYCIGPELWRLGAVLNKRISLAAISEPVLRRHVSEINETMYLFTYSKDQLTFDMTVECSHPLRYYLKIGVPYDIRRGAAGKVILANLPPEKAERIFADLRGDHDINVDELKQKVEAVRAKGYSFTVNERVMGIVGFAAPIYGSNQVFLGGALVTIPEVRYRQKNHKAYAELVKRCAGEISFIMGSKQPQARTLKK
jgi:DNA-binding IclR family transcriptional regulator